MFPHHLDASGPRSKKHGMFSLQRRSERVAVRHGVVKPRRHPHHGALGNAGAPDGMNLVLVEQTMLHLLRVGYRMHAFQPEACNGAIPCRIARNADFDVGDVLDLD